MSRKHLSSALLVSVVSLPLLYLITSQSAALGQAWQLLVLIALVFLASLASAWLSSRNTTGTAKSARSSKPARRERSQSRQDTSTASGPRESGQVKWFNASKGFGFITRDNGDDIFVHFRSIRGDGHRVLKDGQRVEFSVSMGDKGLQADDVAAHQ